MFDPAGSSTPLRDKFDAHMRKLPMGLSSAMAKALLEAFMAGAAAHDNVIREAVEDGADAEGLALICDAMVNEMRNRHRTN